MWPQLVMARNEGLPIKIAEAVKDQQNPYVIALSDKNKWFVVWEDWRSVDAAGSNSGADIWGQFINGDGSLCGSAFIISDADNNGVGDDGHQTVPSAAYAQDQQMIGVVWQDSRGSASGGYVYYRGLDVSGISGNSCSVTATNFTNESNFGFTAVFAGAELYGRIKPKIAYDFSGNRFWVAWVEHRSTRKHVFGTHRFACSNMDPFEWTVGDTSHIGYAALNANNLTVAESPEIFHTPDQSDGAGNDYVQNIRMVSHSLGAQKEIFIYEYFDSINNVDIEVNPTSGDVLLTWEGVARTLGVINEYIEDQDHSARSRAFDCETPQYDDASSTAVIKSGFYSDFENLAEEEEKSHVGIYGIFRNQIEMTSLWSMRISEQDDDYSAYMPSVAVDPVTSRFLVVWEDASSEYQKIYGQLVNSGGGKYSSNFVVSYQNFSGGENNELADSKQTDPFVSYDPVNQRYFVAWQDGRNSAVSQDNLDIYGQYVDAEGSLRGSNYLISASDNGISAVGNQYSPAVAFNSGSAPPMFLAVWKDARNYSSARRSDIYGQRFTLGQPQMVILNSDNTQLVPPVIDFGSQQVNSDVVTVGFKVKNVGDASMNVCSVTPLDSATTAFYYKVVPDQLSDNNDSTCLSLSPGSEINLQLGFIPGEARSYQQDIKITSDAGSTNIVLQGVGLSEAPVGSITIDIDSLDFGSVLLGSSKVLRVTLSNDSDQDITLLNASALEEDGAAGAAFRLKFIPEASGDYVIKAGEKSYLIVTFSPAAVTTYNEEVWLLFNDSQQQISLTGRGIAGDVRISVTPGSIDYGTVQVGTSVSRTIIVTNSGTGSTKLLAVDVPSQEFRFDGSVIGTTLEPGGSVSFYLTFMPNDIGAVSANIGILTSEQSAPHLIPVEAEVVSPPAAAPVIECTPSSVEFDETLLGKEGYKLVTCSNRGEADAVILGVEFEQTEDVFSIATYSEITQNGDVTLPAGEAARLWLQFRPEEKKDYSATVKIRFDYTDEPAEITLGGSGINYDPANPPAISYYLFSDLPQELTLMQGQAQVAVLEMKGQELIVNKILPPSRSFFFEKVLEEPGTTSVLDPAGHEGHYIYSLYISQQNYQQYLNGQFMVMDSKFNTLFESVMMWQLVQQPGWSEIPAFSVNLNGKKAVYLSDSTRETEMTMHVVMSWAGGPVAVNSGDIYLIMVNQDLSKMYCYDTTDMAFAECNPLQPTWPDASRPRSEALELTFKMPSSATTGLYRIYYGMVAEDGMIFYDQAAVILNNAVGGDIVGIY